MYYLGSQSSKSNGTSRDSNESYNSKESNQSDIEEINDSKESNDIDFVEETNDSIESNDESNSKSNILFHPIAGKRANDTKLGEDRNKMLY